jgi:predicted ATP-grasp superfamily ATP-dependent carboligase
VAMRVLVYEYCHVRRDDPTAGVTASLLAEGGAMLGAVLADLRAAPGLRASSFAPVSSAAAEESAFRAAVRAGDAALVIAPELGGLLTERCRWVEEEGRELLGPSSAAVRLASDKLALAAHLAGHGVPTPPTWAWADVPQWPRPAVVKPRDGAGSQDVFLLQKRPAEPPAAGELVVQPLAPGRAASVAFLIGPGLVMGLPPAWQRLSDDGRFRYLGGELPLPADLAARAESVARQAVGCVPGLRGYVGVDLVLGDDPGGAGDAVIEINPRLTTSYVGLRALAEGNLAAAMLAVLRGENPVLRWRSGSVRFVPDGMVEPV